MALGTIQGTANIEDCYLQASNPTTNFNDDSIIDGQDTTDATVRRGLIQFSLTSIPSGATINGGTITLTVRIDRSANARLLSFYRVRRDWVVTEATWNAYSTGNNWTTAGAADTTNDRESDASGTVTQPAVMAVDEKLSITLTPSKLQDMIPGGTWTNNGFLLQVATESDDAILYHSTNQGTLANGPILVIDYTPGSSGLFTKYW